jgi:hypothetical protein
VNVLRLRVLRLRRSLASSCRLAPALRVRFANIACRLAPALRVRFANIACRLAPALRVRFANIALRERRDEGAR